MLPWPADKVTPEGSPLTPIPTPVNFSPPTGVTLTVIWPLAVCVIDSVDALSPTVNPGACCTCTVTVFVAVTPSPVAVTVTAVVPTVAFDPAVSVNVELAPPFVSVTPFALHDAVTPLGNPLTLSVTAPLNVPFAANVIASIAVLPGTTLTVLDAVASERVGGVNVTVSGTFVLAATVDPPFAATLAVNPSVAVPATAAGLPVSVRVHAAAPAAFTAAALQLAVTPFGNPDATLMLEPEPPLATTAPPTGVAVTVIVADPSDCIETAAGEAINVKLGAWVTCSVTLLVAVNPSPAAVTVSVELPTAVAAPAAIVSVALADPDAGLTGFADHVAVIPLDNPLRLRLTFPVNDPPVLTAKLTGPLAPCATATALAPAVSASVGGALTVSA